MNKLTKAIESLTTLAAAKLPSETKEDRESYGLALEVLNHPAANNGVSVRAYILENKEDPSAAALFANGHRAGAYSQMLADSGTYKKVTVEVGGSTFEVRPKK